MADVFEAKRSPWQSDLTIHFGGQIGQECYATVTWENEEKSVSIGSTPADALANLVKYCGDRLNRTLMLKGLNSGRSTDAVSEGGWEVYVSPGGVKGWRHRITGKIAYQIERPDYG